MMSKGGLQPRMPSLPLLQPLGLELLGLELLGLEEDWCWLGQSEEQSEQEDEEEEDPGEEGQENVEVEDSEGLR